MFNKTRVLLEELSHLPNKKLGQNFLIDGNILRKSIEMAKIDAEDAIVEVGPGLGTLTQALLETGASVWAVERDPTLAKHLRKTLADSDNRLHLTENDCLEYPCAGLPEERAASGFKVVANLPYAVSTPWMDAILTGPLPKRMVLMLQKEAADRYSALHGSKSFGAISIFLQSAYCVHDRHSVSANCFYPKPKVDSVLLCLDKRTAETVYRRETLPPRNNGYYALETNADEGWIDLHIPRQSVRFDYRDGARTEKNGQ